MSLAEDSTPYQSEQTTVAINVDEDHTFNVAESLSLTEQNTENFTEAPLKRTIKDYIKPHVPLLSELCVKSIVSNFEKYPRTNIPAKYQQAVFGQISLDIPITLTINLFGDDGNISGTSGSSIYWKRLCKYIFPQFKCDCRQHRNSWKATFFEVMIENLLECSNSSLPKEKYLELAKMAAPYVETLDVKNMMPNDWFGPQNGDLIITSLTTNKPFKQSLHGLNTNWKIDLFKWDAKVTGLNEEASTQRSHIDLKLVLDSLPNLKHFSLCTNVKEMEMGYNRHLLGFSLTDLKQLSSGVARSKLVSLTLSFNRIADEQAKVLINGISACTSLENLNLAHNDISDGGLCEIAEAVKACRWKCLNISNNKFTANGLRALTDAICLNKTIKTLDFSLNSKAYKAWPDAIESIGKGNQSVEEINLSGCRLGEKFMESLIQILLYQMEGNKLQSKQYGLKKINLSANPDLTDKIVEPLITILASPDCLVSDLDLRGTMAFVKTIDQINQKIKTKRKL